MTTTQASPYASRMFVILVWILALFGAPLQTQGAPHPQVATEQQHFEQGVLALDKADWKEALVHFTLFLNHYPESPLTQEALFHTAVCYFSLGELDIANQRFSLYLTQMNALSQFDQNHFEQVFSYKLAIADLYAEGKKKHLFGVRRLPKWSSGKVEALALYDEIIASLAGKEPAAQALCHKAAFLAKRAEYEDAIEALQLVIRRFPRQSYASWSYKKIAEIYLEQSIQEAQNPDLLSLAEINLRKFTKDFPSDETRSELESRLESMRQVYARRLYEMGRFYERKRKPHAAAIYYQDALQKYPKTQAATLSSERLAALL